MITTKGKIEIVLNPETVQEWDYLHSSLQDSIGQLLLELSEGLLHGETPPFTFETVNGFEIQKGEYHLGHLKFTPAGIDVPDETEKK